MGFGCHTVSIVSEGCQPLHADSNDVQILYVPRPNGKNTFGG